MAASSGSGSAPAFVDGKPFGTHSKELLGSVVSAVRAVQKLPQGTDYGFHRTNQAFRAAMQRLSARTLQKLDSLVKWENPSSDLHPGDASFDDADRMDVLVETCDMLLERVDGVLDDMSGLKGAVLMHTAPVTSVVSQPMGKAQARIMHAQNIRRPQVDFKDTVDNSAAPFVPKLKEKPNAQVPLPVSESGELEPEEAEGRKFYPHPYEQELRAFEVADKFLQAEPDKEPMPLLDADTAEWIDTEEALQGLKEALDKQTEIAIDLEAHSYRTYQGFVCLMQLTIPGGRDYLVDTLALRSHLHVLNSSFTNPNIVKVMHGADGDILWLQRDFGLYIVNMFDTGQASRVLSYPKFSLAYLLKLFCDVTPNKAFQLADWRIRPLSLEMLKYARGDTHFLLWIYHRLKNQLIAAGNEQKNLLRAVWTRSRDICLQRYEKPIYSEERAMELYSKHNRQFNGVQLNVYKRLHAWRDQLAREEDESPRYVMPDHMLFELASILPRETTQVLACCQPVPPLVRMHSHTILEVIIEGKQAEPLMTKGKTATAAASSDAVVPDITDADLTFGGGQEPEEEVLAVRELFDAAGWVTSSKQSSSFAQMLVDDNFEDIEAAESARKAAGITASFANEALFTRLQAWEEAAQMDEEEDQQDEPVPMAAEEVPSTAAVPSAKDDQGDQDSEDIFTLGGSSSRQRNKERKKLREHSANLEISAAALGEEGSHEQSMSPDAFMDHIGWPQRQTGRGATTFDFASAGPSSLAGGAGSDVKGGKGSFAPYSSKSQEKSGPKSHVRPKSGPRSMTFSTNK